jgi:hypothetical protein
LLMAYSHDWVIPRSALLFLRSFGIFHTDTPLPPDTLSAETKPVAETLGSPFPQKLKINKRPASLADDKEALLA